MVVVVGLEDEKSGTKRSKLLIISPAFTSLNKCVDCCDVMMMNGGDCASSLNICKEP